MDRFSPSSPPFLGRSACYRNCYVLVVLVLLMQGCSRTDQKSFSDAHSKLSALLSDQRVVEPRLTGGSGYSACRQEPKQATLVALPRCPSVSRELLVELLNRFERTAAIRGEEAKAPDELRDQAIVYLMAGTETLAQQAVAKLEEAICKWPKDATLHSDLAAARIVLAGLAGEPYELVRSMDSSGEALRLAPDLAAARFNQALALEKLFLTNQAAAAWRNYREVDPFSFFGREAERRAAAQTRPPWDDEWKVKRADLEGATLRGDRAKVEALVDAYRQPVREVAQEEWLPAWADAWINHRETEAERQLSFARAVGGTLTRRAGDAMIEATVSAIETTGLAGRGFLAKGLLAYRDGRSLYMAMRFSEAEPHLREASQLLRRGGSPLSGWADLFATACVFFRADYPLARRQLDELRHRTSVERYPVLAGRLFYSLGIVRTVEADFSGALAAYQRGLSLFDRTGELENIAAVRHVVAEDLSFLGQPARAWRERYRALSVLDRIPNSSRRTSLLEEATEACLLEGNSALALFLQSELLDGVSRWQNGMMRPQALVKRSRIALSLGRFREAQADLTEAEREAVSIADPDIKEETGAQILRVRSQLSAVRNPLGAKAEIDEALLYFQRVGARLSLVSARQHRARLRLALGDAGGAESDLRAGIEEYEAQRSAIAQDFDRTRFFAQSRALFDSMVELQVKRGLGDAAFLTAERSRARSLLDQVAALGKTLGDSASLLAAQAPPLGSGDLRKLLARQVAVVEYYFLGERLLIWVVTSDGIALREIAVNRRELEKSLKCFFSDLRQPGRAEALRLQAEQLYDLLLAPVDSLLLERRRLVFVPDGPLFGLPFAALAKRERSRLLVEDHEIVVAPSASVFVRLSDRDKSFYRGIEHKVLAVGNPLSSDSVFNGGGALPVAETEAKEVAGLYPRSVLLLGADATAPRFLRGVAESEVVHFAGHARVDATYPLFSALLFAPETGLDGSGPLFAHQIYGRRFPRTRVVVLAACSTGRGDAGLAEEAIGLARPFLAAGIPAVVASLSAVGDRQSLALLKVFHRRYLESGDPVAALAEAQRERIVDQGGERFAPWSWAAFEVFGGSGLPN